MKLINLKLLDNYELNEKKIITVVDAPFAVVKRKPENIQTISKIVVHPSLFYYPLNFLFFWTYLASM